MPEWLVRYARPREGWMALALLFVMLLSVSWSIQRAGWIDRSDFLVPVAFYAVIAGALLGLTRLTVVAVLPLSAVLGTGFVLWAVGGEYFVTEGQLGRLLSVRGEVIDWVRVLLDRGAAPQLVPWAIGFGLLMWATAFIGAYTMYRHHRAMDAIVLVGAAIVVNMSASTAPELFFYLVLFTLAALLLWLRASLIGREEGWQRRRVNENAEVPAAVMRSGVAFIAGSIALAWVLTSVAVAAPLTAVWNNLDGVWSGVRDRLDGVFGSLANPDARITGTTFGARVRVTGNWTSSDQPVLLVSSSRAYYLRTATYETYSGIGFDRGGVDERRVAVGEPIFSGYSPEIPLDPESYEAERVLIEYQESLDGAMFTPGFPYEIGAPVIVLETGGLPILGGLESPNAISPGRGYYVTALISKATQAQLNAAGTDYPPEILANYMGTPGVTDRTRAEARRIVDEAGAQTPFEMAQALADYLRTDDRFTYATSAEVPPAGGDLVDFFLFDPNGQTGYCEYYATTMAVMARTLGLPSRVATGFAPGEPTNLPGQGREGDGNIYQYRLANAHAWAEIYFPGYGWERFEATKTIAPVVRLAGDPVTPGGSGAPRPTSPPSLTPEDVGDFVDPSFDPVEGGVRPGEEAPPADPRGGNLLLIAAIVIVVAAIAAWRLRAARRRLRFLAPGERQWFRLALAADRAGVSQRPNETIYEYAGWLEEQIPRRRPEIRTIADGKVWQSYSGRGVSGDAMARIEAAWRRLELPMLWLTLKRRLGGLIPRRLRGG